MIPKALIDQFMPSYRILEVDRVRVAANPEKVWRIIRHGNLAQPLFTRALFAMRVLPEAMAKIFRGESPNFVTKETKIDDIAKPGNGFQILGEVEGQEIVIGSIGKWWRPEIEFYPVASSEFPFFVPSGYGKLVWNIRIDPSEFEGSWISVELRVTTTDEEAWRHFQPYWFLIGRFSRAIRRGALHAYQREFGFLSETKLKLPGDEILDEMRFSSTLGKTIEAPPEKIWPWLVQMGCRRAGWYSIDFLDNAGVPSSDQILPEFQKIEVGDILPMTPKGEEGFAVLSVKKNESLILGSPSLLPFNEGHLAVEPPFVDTWAFVLEPIGSKATRLMTRVNANYEPSLKAETNKVLVGAAHQIMQKAQLKNLKRRAELRT